MVAGTVSEPGSRSLRMMVCGTVIVLTRHATVDEVLGSCWSWMLAFAALIEIRSVHSDMFNPTNLLDPAALK